MDGRCACLLDLVQIIHFQFSLPLGNSHLGVRCSCTLAIVITYNNLVLGCRCTRVP